MKNLLKSDFYRLFKSKSYYICMLVAAALIIVGLVISNALSKQDVAYATLLNKDGMSYGLKTFGDGNVIMIMSIFISIFVTAEFSQGTMKNVVSKGFSKVQVYLSKLVTMTVATYIAFLVAFIVSVVGGSIITGKFGDFTGAFVGIAMKTIGIELLLTLAMTAVFVMIAMVFKNLGGVIAINIIGVFTFLNLIFSALQYLVDNKIKFTEFSLSYNMSLYGVDQVAGSIFLRSTIVGLVFLAVFTALGLWLFKKADVK